MIQDPGLVATVIVPCRNERGEIEAFLDDLEKQQGVPGEWEVIVADGDSDDGTLEILRRRAASNPRLCVVRNELQHVSPGLNLALNRARGRYVIRMDVHTSYAEDYIAACLDVMEETGAANVGGAARTEAEGPAQRAVAAAYASAFAVGPASFHFPDYEGEVDTVTYGCWSREDLLAWGGFDEDLVRNQDDELNLRIRRGGGVVWQSRRIRSWYRPRGNLRSLFKQYYQYGFWKVAVIRKHRIPASWRHLVPAGGLLAVAAAILLGFRWEPAWWFVGAAAALYLGFLLTGSIVIARRHGWDLLARLPATLATFHLSYALGFLNGMFAKQGKGHNTSLSR